MPRSRRQVPVVASSTSTWPLRASSSTTRAWRRASRRRSGRGANGDSPTAVCAPRRAATRCAAAVVARAASSAGRAGSSAHTMPSSWRQGAPGNCSAMMGPTHPARSGRWRTGRSRRAPGRSRRRRRRRAARQRRRQGPRAAPGPAPRRRRMPGSSRSRARAVSATRPRDGRSLRPGRRLAAVGERDHGAQRLGGRADRGLGDQPGPGPGGPVGERSARSGGPPQAPVARARRDRAAPWAGATMATEPAAASAASRATAASPPPAERPRPCARAGRPGALRAAHRAQG